MVCSAPTDVSPLSCFLILPCGGSGRSQPQNLADSISGGIEELVACGEREPDVAFARRAKCEAGGHRDVSLLEEKIGGLGRGHAGAADVGERVERTLNQRA